MQWIAITVKKEQSTDMQQVRHGADQFDYASVQVKSNLLMKKK